MHPHMSRCLHRSMIATGNAAGCSITHQQHFTVLVTLKATAINRCQGVLVMHSVCLKTRRLLSAASYHESAPTWCSGCPKAPMLYATLAPIITMHHSASTVLQRSHPFNHHSMVNMPWRGATFSACCCQLLHCQCRACMPGTARPSAATSFSPNPSLSHCPLCSRLGLCLL
jgi:hypothetical protein